MAEMNARLQRLDRMSLVFAFQDTATTLGRTDQPTRSYFLDRFEVTNREFAEFTTATGYDPGPHFPVAVSPAQFGDPDLQTADHPVTMVSAIDAEAYAAWRGKCLPSAGEWRHAAGSRGLALLINSVENRLGGTTRVGTFESGRTRTPFLVAPPAYDLFGNVWEWTASSSPGNVDSLVVLGGSFNTLARDAFDEAFDLPTARSSDLGFRCALRGAADVLGALLDVLVETRDAERQRAYRDLRRFGRPLERLVRRLRVDQATTARFGPVGGGTDLLAALPGGRVVQLDSPGQVRLLDAETGRVLDQPGGFGALLYARTIDADGDGQTEVYVGERAEGGDRLMAACIDRDGEIHLIDLQTGREDAWAEGPSILPRIRDRCFGVEEYRNDLLRDRTGLRQGFTAPTYPRFIGLILPLSQILHCFDVRDDRLVERWSRRLPISSEPLFTADGWIVVPGLDWYRVQNGALDFPVIARFARLRARDGSGKVQPPVPGGCRFVVRIGDTREPQFLLKTLTDDLLEVTFAGDRMQLSPGRFGAEANLLAARAGPAPGELTLLWSGTVPRQLRLQVLDPRGESLAERSFTGDPPAMHVDPELGILLRIDKQQLWCLDDRLDIRWRIDDLIGFDVDQQWPRLVRFLPGRPQLLVLSTFTGFSLLDPRTLSTLDSFHAEDGTILSVTPVPRRGRADEDLLVATFRDRALYTLRRPCTQREHELKRLQANLIDEPDAAQ